MSADKNWIGQIFRRIAPGSSFAAFPWKSWDKICTILESIKSKTIDIHRTSTGSGWSLDVKPELLAEVENQNYAYRVIVKPYIDNDSDSGGDQDDAGAVFCLLPIDIGVAGANTTHIYGEPGQKATVPSESGQDEEERDPIVGWAWEKIGVSTGAEQVVYGRIKIDKWDAFLKNGIGPTFEDITLGSAADFQQDCEDASKTDYSLKEWIVPIAWIHGKSVVQALLGRPVVWRETPDTDRAKEEQSSGNRRRSIERIPVSGSGSGTGRGEIQLRNFQSEEASPVEIELLPKEYGHGETPSTTHDEYVGSSAREAEPGQDPPPQPYFGVKEVQGDKELFWKSLGVSLRIPKPECKPEITVERIANTNCTKITVQPKRYQLNTSTNKVECSNYGAAEEYYFCDNCPPTISVSDVANTECKKITIQHRHYDESSGECVNDTGSGSADEIVVCNGCTPEITVGNKANGCFDITIQKKKLGAGGVCENDGAPIVRTICDGGDGKDGCSPLVASTGPQKDADGCITVTITERELVNGQCANKQGGTHVVKICDGANGANGADACPLVVTDTGPQKDADGCITVTVKEQIRQNGQCVDKQGGTHTFKICDGDDGSSGKNGCSPTITQSSPDSNGLVTITITERELVNGQCANKQGGTYSFKVPANGSYWIQGAGEQVNYGTGIKIGEPGAGYVSIDVVEI